MQEGGLLGEFSLDVVFLEVERFDGPDELVVLFGQLRCFLMPEFLELHFFPLLELVFFLQGLLEDLLLGSELGLEVLLLGAYGGDEFV